MYAGMSANDKAAYACGGIFVAGMLYFVLALIIKLVGVNRVMKFLPPVVTGPSLYVSVFHLQVQLLQMHQLTGYLHLLHLL